MVVELKKKIEAEPEQYHFIKGENNLSRPKHSGHDSGLIFSRNMSNQQMVESMPDEEANTGTHKVTRSIHT